MNRPFDVTVYGEAALHVICERSPVPRLAIGGVVLDVGGPAAVVSRQLALLGHHPRFIGVCGDDPPGRLVRKALADSGVDCAEIIGQGATTVVAAVVGEGDGEVRLTAQPGVGWQGSQWQDAPPEPAAGPAYVTGFPDLLPAIQTLGRAGHRLVVDVGFLPLLADPEALRRHVAAIAFAMRICVVSGATLAPATRQSVIDICLDNGVSAVLITLGAAGVQIADEHGRTHLPAHPVRAVDALCAGDTFVAGLLSGLCSGRTIPESAARGQAVAAAKVSTFGRLPTRDEVDRMADQVVSSGGH